MYLDQNNDLSTEGRELVGTMLNHALADEFALSAVTRDFHWNVTGPHFHSLHELFDEQYRQLDQWIEKIGERARTVGASVRTGWSELIKTSQLTPTSGVGLTANAMMTSLIALHDRMANRLGVDAARCGDPATGELLTALVEYHETTAWLLGELLEDRQRALA